MNREKWIVPYLRKYKGLFFLAIFLGSLAVLFTSGLMFTSGYLITKSALKPESILLVYVPIVGVRAFGIGRAVLNYAAKLTGHQFVLKILSEMRVRLYKILEPQAFFLRTRFQTGDLLGVLANDIEHLQNFYLKTLIPSLVSLLIYSLIIFSAGIFSFSFAAMLMILIGLLIFVGPIISLLYLKAKNERLKAVRQQLYQKFTDGMFGISDLIFSGRHLSFSKQYEAQEKKLQLLESRKRSFQNRRDIGSQFILGTIVVLTIYWVDGKSVEGSFSPVFIAAVGLMMLSLLESFLPVADAVSDTSSYHDSLERLKKIQTNDQGLALRTENLRSFIDRSKLSIAISHLTFAYQQERPLLKDINLSVHQGEKIAILGRSGAGKSTLLKLVMGAMAPVSGDVYVNGISIQKLVPIVPSMMAVLNQKPYLFNTSVINNIRLGDPEATDEEVFEAAKMVQLHKMITKLPKGYETNMLEAGQRFSGGEQQRIALARIILQKTPIVIMDEPTVGLDPATEATLLAIIFDTLKDKTIIWVTHHLTGVEKMDRVLFIEDGKIIMDGNHRELLANEERYRRLYKLDRPFAL